MVGGRTLTVELGVSLGELTQVVVEQDLGVRASLENRGEKLKNLTESSSISGHFSL